MTCPRCHGLVVDDAGIVRCLNCGYRPIVAYIPPPVERMNADREARAYDDRDAYKQSIIGRRGRGPDKQPRKTHAR